MQFVGTHPTWPSFQQAMADWFPGGIYDTKHLCKFLNDRHERLLPDTSLGPLFEGLNAAQENGRLQLLLADARRGGAGPLELPAVSHAQGFTRCAAPAR